MTTTNIETENQILSAGDECLPPVARMVRDGADLTDDQRAEYDAWLAGQVAEMARDAEVRERNGEWAIGLPGREQVATRWNSAAGSTEDIYVADDDGEVLIELWTESGAGFDVVARYLPAEVLAEVLRRSGWTVTRGK